MQTDAPYSIPISSSVFSCSSVCLIDRLFCGHSIVHPTRYTHHYYYVNMALVSFCKQRCPKAM